MSMKRPERLHVEISPKRVRAYLGGEAVFDTIRALLVWEKPYYPTYYIPVEDVRVDLVEAGTTEGPEGLGEGNLYDIKAGAAGAERAARRYPKASLEDVRGAVRFEWGALDEWLEEDDPVYTHARDPYKRVDILSSSRHVEVSVDGVKVADSTRPTILFETGLPPRYYLPLTDVRMDLLKPSDTQTRCPYKGSAEYWTLVVDGREHKDLVWTYRTPFPESQKVAGLVCFYNERVDLKVDGDPQHLPKTKFS